MYQCLKLDSRHVIAKLKITLIWFKSDKWISNDSCDCLSLYLIPQKKKYNISADL